MRRHRLPLRATMRLGLALLTAVSSSACMGAQGSFENVFWGPTTSAFAVADRHDLVVSRGTVVATRRAESDQRLTLFFSGASVQPNDQWRGYAFTRLLDVRRDLAMNDALLIDDIPLADVVPGAAFETEWTGTGRFTDGAFDTAMVLGPSLVANEASTPIGERTTVVVSIDEADARAGGFVRGTVEVTRARTDDQEGNVATGTVTWPFQVSVVAERRGKSNLAIARPILVCAAEKGPSRSAGCRDADPELELEASGLQSSL